jgi:hypothetical protein
MAFGRPRRRNDPSVMASVEAAISTVARPGPLGWLWHWRYEIGVIAGLTLVELGSDAKLGVAGLIAITATGLALLTAALVWPPSRRRLIARAWCVITPHRVRTGCVHAWIQTRDGRLPTILFTTAADFGERVTLWCHPGITAGDLEAASDILSTACWASDVRVLASGRYRHIVVLEVIRRAPPQGPSGVTIPTWPYLNRGEAEGIDDEEPALYGGPGHYRPLG